MTLALTVDCSPMITQCPSASAFLASLTAAGTFSMVLHVGNIARRSACRHGVQLSATTLGAVQSLNAFENVRGLSKTMQ
jgi:hypothetical protein